LVGWALFCFDQSGLVQIPTEAGRVFRREGGHHSEVKPATIPI